jgi:hypothetical protein
MFATKKVNAQTKRTTDQNNTASPNKIRSIPVIIGFLIYRYGPATTNFFGGSQGAGVPFPHRKKRRVVVPARKEPTTMRNIDTPRTMIFSEYVTPSPEKTEERYKKKIGIKIVTLPGSRIILQSNDFIIHPIKKQYRIRVPIR